jgi:quercetin dioxygenase-like cupin family protein
MAVKTGDVFRDLDGSVFIVTRAAAETGGEYVEIEFELPSGCSPPPPHIHPHQVEEYEVLEGHFDVMVDGQWRALSPGERASVPRGVVHTFRNRSGSLVRVRNWHRPALRFEDFAAAMYGTLQAAGIKRRRDPRVPIYLSMVLRQFEDTIVPAPRLRPVVNALARLGRLLRLRTAPT